MLTLTANLNNHQVPEAEGWFAKMEAAVYKGARRWRPYRRINTPGGRHTQAQGPTYLGHAGKPEAGLSHLVATLCDEEDQLGRRARNPPLRTILRSPFFSFWRYRTLQGSAYLRSILNATAATTTFCESTGEADRFLFCFLRVRKRRAQKEVRYMCALSS